jgi:hypothetical protein
MTQSNVSFEEARMFQLDATSEPTAADAALAFHHTWSPAPDPIGEPQLSSTEAVLRAVNDRIRELGGTWQGRHDFVCECANPRCLQVVTMPPGVYDELRSTPRQFVLVPGHEQAASETLVSSGLSYLVVLRPDVSASAGRRTAESEV